MMQFADRPMAATSNARRALALALALLLAACASVPLEERMLSPGPNGQVDGRTEPCNLTRPPVLPVALMPGHVIDLRRLRLASWNLHKGSDEGWQADLTRYVGENDIVLLQEAVLNAPVREVLERAGHSWRMAGAFAYNGEERGVLVAARVQPIQPGRRPRRGPRRWSTATAARSSRALASPQRATRPARRPRA